MSSKNTKDRNNVNMSLVRQDPRTKVKTTVAQSQTTNTTVNTSTKFGEKTIEYVVQRQTITHEERAGIAEICKRYTPTDKELEELMEKFNINKYDSTTNNTKRKSGNFTPSNEKVYGISTKSSPKFKTNSTPLHLNTNRDSYLSGDDNRGSRNFSNTDKTYKIPTPTTPIVGKTLESHVTQSQHRTVTSHTEKNVVKLQYTNGFNLSSPNSPLTKLRLDAMPVKMPTTTYTTMTTTTTSPRQGVSNTSYISPYRNNELLNNLAPKTATTANMKVPTTITSSRQSSITPVTGKKLKPGRAYIFNHEKFDDLKETRIGTKKDVEMLQKTFGYFGLKYEVYQDSTVKQIKKVAATIEKKDFTNYSCVVVVILTHGSRHEIVSAKDNSYSYNDELLHPMLRNRTLQNKPKIFFIQACKGEIAVGGFSKDSSQPYGPPSNILQCYSTFEGYLSYRSEEGTIFIQTLCEFLKIYGDTADIQDVIDKVITEVKKRSKGTQTPSVTKTDMMPYVFGHYSIKK